MGSMKQEARNDTFLLITSEHHWGKFLLDFDGCLLGNRLFHTYILCLITNKHWCLLLWQKQNKIARCYVKWPIKPWHNSVHKTAHTILSVNFQYTQDWCDVSVRASMWHSDTNYLVYFTFEVQHTMDSEKPAQMCHYILILVYTKQTKQKCKLKVNIY